MSRLARDDRFGRCNECGEVNTHKGTCSRSAMNDPGHPFHYERDWRAVHAGHSMRRGDSIGRPARGPVWWFPKRAARAAIKRCYGIPYLREISRREHHGMLLLERAGDVVRDEAGWSLHWHRRLPSCGESDSG